MSTQEKELIKQLEKKLNWALKRIEKLEELEKLWQEHIKICPLFQKKETPSFVKPDNNHRHKKTGQKNGHEGNARHIPKRIDFVKKATIHKCPDCGGRLSKIQETRERYVEDIPETRTIITRYEIERRYCKRCKKVVEAKINNALPNARFGLRLMLLVLMLKIGMRMPSKKIKELMQIQYMLAISDGEIYKILEQLSNAFGSYYKELKKKIRQAAIKHIDETGWRIDGKNSWLWIFINKEVALYVVRKRRSSKVPVRLLGKQEDKICVSDRHSAYSQLAKETGCSQQICWSHILRNSKDLTENYEEAKYIHRRLKQIYRYATKLNHKATKQEKEKLLHWIDLIASKRYKHIKVGKFVRGVCRKHRENSLRFVDNPEVDSTNNLAERGLRHAVVIRKISNGSRSEKGAEITSRLLSVIQTLKLQNKNPITGMQDVLLQNSK